MLHHRRRLLLALTPLLVIGLVAVLLALRLATVDAARLQAERAAASDLDLAPTSGPPACRLAVSGFDGPPLGESHRRG